jgi:Mg-chelatase subunit ChlD
MSCRTPVIVEVGTYSNACDGDSGSGGSGGGGGDDVTPPSTDDRCADPAFADANPDLCAGYPRLVLKPEYALTESGGTVQYSTYVRSGGDEHLITLGLAYKVANPSIAVIEADGGLASGVQTGITTVSVTWQNLSAFAQLEVVAACSDHANNFILLIDDSASMKVAFDSTYSSRLNFSKEASGRFIDSMIFARDQVAVAKFDSAGAVVQTFTAVASTAKTAVNAITGTLNQTSLADGLTAAIASLDATSGASKIIVLFSDGENNTGDDPVQIAKAFKDAGGFIVVVATRAWGTFFTTLYQIASGGFFLSAYSDTAETVIQTLINLKTYLCSGSCNPEPGTAPKAQLNYFNFANWDVYQGTVDLCGLGLYDLLPGHGLYVDMGGTTFAPPGVGPYSTLGGIRSKTAFSFISGNSYKFKIKVAGNQRIKSADDSLLVTIGGHLSETIVPTGYKQAFTEYEFDFVAASTDTAKIQIEMLGTASNNVGPIIDDVYLQDTTASSVFMDDDFDTENPVSVDPSYYNYGYGCIVSPPGAQTADPTPPPVFVE